MSLSPAVRAPFPAFTQRFEGRVPWAYRDARGLVTVGLGCLVDPLTPEVLDLPWRMPSGAAAPRSYAAADWRRVKGMQAALPASAYRDPTGLHLDDDAIDALALERLDADVAILERVFGDLSALPEQAQTVLCSLAWAVGANFPSTWPRFTAAVLARDWATAAAECRISEAGNPGVKARNDACQALLEGLVAGPGLAPVSMRLSVDCVPETEV